MPASKGKTSFVDARDVAAVTVKTLIEPGHENKTYPLTGGEALDYFEVARTFTESWIGGSSTRTPRSLPSRRGCASGASPGASSS